MNDVHPKLFISYSWSSQEHEEWVLMLATELVGEGVDVILDKWGLKEGDDAHSFMEKMVNDPDIKKVAIICDRIYAEKADGRSGGVGTETQIISPEVYNKQSQNKFVAIVAQKDDQGRPYLPIYYKPRIYIDLSNPDLYASNFEKLLRWIYDKPLYVKPELGKEPSFLTEASPISLGTTVKQKRAVEAIRNSRDYAMGALGEYFEAVVENLERFRISDGEGEFDDSVMTNVDQFIPYRNEVIEIFLAIAQYHNTPQTEKQLHRFFERLIPYMFAPTNLNNHRESDYDNYRFVIHELFLYAIACLLNREAFGLVAYLVKHDYYIERNEEYGRNVMVPFPILRQPMRSLRNRNERLKLNRLSIRADMLEARSKGSGISFRQIMQADFVLYLRSCLDVVRNNSSEWWWPETLLYVGRHAGSFEIFARAQSTDYFENIKTIFDIKQKNEFEQLFSLYRENKLLPTWEFDSIDPITLLGYKKIATKP